MCYSCEMRERTSAVKRLKNKLIGGEIPVGLAARIRDEVLQSVATRPTQTMIAESTPQTRIAQFEETTYQPGNPEKKIKRKLPLSNFYPTTVTYNGKRFPNVESAFQAAKFESFVSMPDAALEKVNTALTRIGLPSRTGETLGDVFTDFTIYHDDPYKQPKAAKEVARILGKKEYGLLREDWREINLELMVKLLLEKFTQREMAEYLRSTKGKFLFEGNTWNDDFYGVTMDETGNLVDGKNILGRILMNIREKLDSGELPRQKFVMLRRRRG